MPFMNPIRHLLKRGFNLIEAAIVLGVIGLALGGFWIATAAVQENMRMNKFVANIAIIQQKLAYLYKDVPFSGTYTYQTITPLVKTIAPPDMLEKGALVDPWSRPLQVDIDNYANKGWRIFVKFTYTDASQCINAIQKIYSEGSSASLRYNRSIEIYFTVTGGWQYPTAATSAYSIAQTYCPQNSYVHLVLIL